MPSLLPCASSWSSPSSSSLSLRLYQTHLPSVSWPPHSPSQSSDFRTRSVRLRRNSNNARAEGKATRHFRARAESDGGERVRGGVPSLSEDGKEVEEEQKKTVNSDDDSFSATSFLSFLCPLLKLFGGGDPSQQRNEILEVATTSLSSFARLPWGSSCLEGTSQKNASPSSPLPLVQLYEFEACPFCRRVREAMTELDLSVEVYPCPKGSLRHREIVRKIGGKDQFPFLVDPSSNISMYESGDIVKYLFQQYAPGGKPAFGLLESTLLTGWMPTLLRAGRGMTLWQKARKDPPPEKFLLFSYENNPYARIVREALCELELPYILHNAGKGSSNHELLFRISGANEVPYLVDPNTGVQMGNYKKILSYLFQTYSSENR